MNRPLFVLLALALLLPATTAHAKKKKKKGGNAEVRAFIDEATDALSGDLWALKDLPAYTGMTMGVSWLGPVAEVSPTSIKIEAKTAISSGWGSAKSLYFSVRAYDTLELKEIDHDDGEFEIVLDGYGDSDGHDTKIKIVGTKSWAEVKDSIFQLLSTTDPADKPDWSDEVKAAIRNRQVINGMTKRQAYLVVGEPDSASSREEDGKKIETWKPRQTNGMKMGYATRVEGTGYPGELRFVDGKLEGVATTSSGGVSLD